MALYFDTVLRVISRSRWQRLSTRCQEQAHLYVILWLRIWWNMRAVDSVLLVSTGKSPAKKQRREICAPIYVERSQYSGEWYHETSWNSSWHNNWGMKGRNPLGCISIFIYIEYQPARYSHRRWAAFRKTLSGTKYLRGNWIISNANSSLIEQYSCERKMCIYTTWYMG